MVKSIMGGILSGYGRLRRGAALVCSVASDGETVTSLVCVPRHIPKLGHAHPIRSTVQRRLAGTFGSAFTKVSYAELAVLLMVVELYALIWS